MQQEKNTYIAMNANSYLHSEKLGLQLYTDKNLLIEIGTRDKNALYE